MSQPESLINGYKIPNIIHQTFINTKLPVEIKNIIKEITPKKGKCVLFNGKHYHASSNPVEGNRCIINFNVN